MFKKNSVFIVLVFLLVQARTSEAQNFRPQSRSRQDMRSDFNSTSVDNTPGMHRIESIKTNYISEKLNLSAQEGDRFWPLYHQYQRELNTVLHQKRQNMLNSNKSAQDIVNDNFDYDTKILDIKKHYNQEFSRMLSPDQLKQLWVSERMFNEEMIQRLKRGHDND